jgi:hypothetical protein
LLILYAAGKWSLTWTEERTLRVFENRMLTKTFGRKKNGVTGEWRRLHNEKLYTLNCSPNIILVIKPRKMIWLGHVTHMGERRGAYRILMGRTEGRRPRRWENNI